MALSNSQYDAIMREYGRQQLENQHQLEARRNEIYRVIPAVRELEAEIASRSVAGAKRLLAGDTGALAELREELADLREQKAILIRAKGYPEDYLTLHYRCPDCEDTGWRQGRKCHCFLRAQMKMLYAQSNLDHVLDQENFSRLSYDYYDSSEIIPELGLTNADYMRRVVAGCREFAADFDRKKENLLFTGSTGVGKTFLTNCIAKELIDSGHSVIYLSAGDLFEVFSRNKFDYDTPEDMRDTYRYILDCDLLIIDDLGTELTNAFVSSQLFLCINERLIRKKSTIISTNLPMNRFSDTYSERVFSRITSNYTMCKLIGDDIRIQKKLSGRKA